MSVSSGLWLHLHQCVRLKGSPGALHKGLSLKSSFSGRVTPSDCFQMTHNSAESNVGNPGSANNIMSLVPNQGDFEAGKYRCLICNKEFNSESGVKYHINSVHSQVTA